MTACSRLGRRRDLPLSPSLSSSCWDGNLFGRCIDESSLPAATIDRDIGIAARLGLTATPGFALGRTDSAGRMTLEFLITGAQSIEYFESAIEGMFSEQFGIKRGIEPERRR